MALFDFLKSPDRHREPPRRNGRANGAADRPRREHGRAEQPPKQSPRPEETRRDYGDEDEDAPRERQASRTQDERRETRRQNHEAETLPPPPRMHQEEKRQRDERQEADPQEQEDRRPRRKPRMPGSRAVVFAREHLMDLLGREPEAVSGLSLGPNGWKVRLEAVEMPRVPSSTDVMATYEVELDEEGELIGYHRVSRYFRNQTNSEQ
jgi:hypothetical protein